MSTLTATFEVDSWDEQPFDDNDRRTEGDLGQGHEALRRRHRGHLEPPSG